MKNKRILLWLDDYRDPKEFTLFHAIQNPTEIIWVKSFKEFINYIKEKGIPDAISFDHDLEDDHYVDSSLWVDYYSAFQAMRNVNYNKNKNSGFDCAKFLVDYCKDKKLAIPKFRVHSANPIGRDLIYGLLNFHKGLERNG